MIKTEKKKKNQQQVNCNPHINELLPFFDTKSLQSGKKTAIYGQFSCTYFSVLSIFAENLQMQNTSH